MKALILFKEIMETAPKRIALILNLLRVYENINIKDQWEISFKTIKITNKIRRNTTIQASKCQY